MRNLSHDPHQQDARPDRRQMETAPDPDLAPRPRGKHSGDAAVRERRHRREAVTAPASSNSASSAEGSPWA